MSLGTPPSTAPTKRPYNINDAETSTNQENIPVPYFAGVAKLTVDWIAPGYNLTSKAVKSASDTKGKSGSVGQQKNWYMDLGGVTNVCPDDAPNDSILFVLVNDEVAFTGPLTRVPGTHYVAFSIPKYCQSCRFYWGTKDQPIDNLVLYPRQDAIPTGVDPREISTWPRINSSGEPVDDVTELPGVANPKSGHYDFHPAYRNQGLFVAKQFFVGSSPNAPTIVMVLARGTKFFAGARFEAGATGVNPMGPAFEALTDDLFGCGIPESQLAASTFTDTGSALGSAGIFLAPAVRNAASARNFFSKYFLNFDGFFRRYAGSYIEAGYFPHGDIDVSALPSVGSDDLVGQPSIKPGSLADTKNCFFVTYTNRAKWWKDDDTEGYIDQANFLKVRVEREDRLERLDIIDGDLAVRHGVEYGSLMAQVPAKGSAVFARERVAARRVGDRFKTNVASLALSFVWRITKAEWPSDRNGTVKFTLENERGIGPAQFIPPAAPKPKDFVVKPSAIERALIVDLPSRLRDLNSMEVAVLAERSTTDAIGFKVYVSLDNVTFDIAAVQHHFAFFGKVTTSYPATTPVVDTSVGMQVNLFGVDLDHVASQSDQERDDFTLLNFCENEILSVGGVTALGAGLNSIFQRRACYGSVQATHPVDAPCWFVFRDHLLPISHSMFQPGATVYFKLVPFTYGGDYDISLVASIAHVFSAGPFLLSGLELAGQGNNMVFTGRDPKFAWRMFSIAGAEITGPELSLGAWDDEFAQFNLRVRRGDTGVVVWPPSNSGGVSKVQEYVYDFEQNARAAGGPFNHFFFGVQAQARDGRTTPWLEIEVQNVLPAGPSGSVTARYDRIDFALNPVTDLDYAGIILLRHKTDPAFGPNDAGVEVAFMGLGPNFSVPQPEATTWYYRSANFDAFTDPALWPGTTAALYALLGLGAGSPVPFTTQTLTPTIPPPPISAGSQSFSTAFDISVVPPSGMKVVYAFDRETLRNSAEWPGGIGAYTTLNIARSCTLHWRGIDASGTLTQEGVATFTLVASGSTGAATCASVQPHIVSGTPGRTTISVSLSCAQSGSTIHVNKNGAGWAVYSAAISLDLDTDSIQFYASASGLQDSSTDYFDNVSRGGL